MSNGDLIAKTREKLGLGDGTERTAVSRDDAMKVLKELTHDVQHGQRAIGMVLWHLDPTPADLTKIAEELELEVETLKSWMTTYSRLRHDADLASVAFSMQKQLARIQNADERMEIWESRPASEWTLTALREAADAYQDRHGGTVLPRIKKAGCKARFDDSREAKVNLELLDDSIEIKVTVPPDIELTDMRLVKKSKGIYAVTFDW